MIILFLLGTHLTWLHQSDNDSKEVPSELKAVLGSHGIDSITSNKRILDFRNTKSSTILFTTHSIVVARYIEKLGVDITLYKILTLKTIDGSLSILASEDWGRREHGKSVILISAPDADGKYTVYILDDDTTRRKISEVTSKDAFTKILFSIRSEK